MLDEADKLLEHGGFLEQIDAILGACTHSALQKCLFSATIPSSVEALAASIMREPIRLGVGLKDGAAQTVQQKLVYVGAEERHKLVAVLQMLKVGELKTPCLLFVQSIERAQSFYQELQLEPLLNSRLGVIHSNQPLEERQASITRFRQGKLWILIATDLLARGLDLPNVQLVVNLDFPQSVQSYIHRIGRTGRAGRTGSAITFFTDDDSYYLKM